MTARKHTAILSKCNHYQHGWKLYQHGDMEGARDMILRSVDTDPNNGPAWALLSRIYAEMDEPEHALEAARQAVRSTPDDAYVHVVLGLRLAAMNHDDEAIPAYDRAIELDGHSGEAYFNRGVSLAKKGDNAKAIDDLRLAVAFDPGFYDLLEHVEELEPLHDLEGFPKPPTAGDNNPFGDMQLPPAI